jgi:hypothetical protein
VAGTTSIQTYNPPPTFTQSNLAFTPLGPGLLSTITTILRPTINVTSSDVQRYVVRMKLPGFSPAGPARDEAFCKSNYVGEEGAPVDDAVSYKWCTDEYNGLHRVIKILPEPHYAVERFAFFNTDTTSDTYEYITMYVNSDQGLSTNVETELNLCCFILPMENPANNPAMVVDMIALLPGTATNIPLTPVKKSPLITRGNYWHIIQVQFNPPLSLALTVLSLKIAPAEDLTNEALIRFYVPGISRVVGDPVGDQIEFNTVGSDWLLFQYFGYWNGTESSLTFRLRPGVVFKARHKVTLRTMPNEFKLPIMMKVNEQTLEVECRSADDVDEIIPRTPSMQSDRVPHIRGFEYSQVRYEEAPDGTVTVHLAFMTNRPMFAGTKIYFKIPGFSSQRTRIPLTGNAAKFIYRETAVLDLPENLVTLSFNKSFYSDEQVATLSMSGMFLPPALYKNDPSLQLWTSDLGAPKQSVQTSPEHGKGFKEFTVSIIEFNPPLPELVSEINFTVQPSIPFYQGNAIKFHLHGVECPQVEIPIVGPDAFRFGNVGIWRSGAHTLSLIVATQETVNTSRLTNVSVPLSSGCQAPLKLTKNDGILAIEGVGAFIKKEGIKSSPKIGTRKYITQSTLEFDPSDPMALTVLKFLFVANADILPTSVVYFKLGGLGRDMDNPTGEVRLSGINAPLFNGSIGYWDNDAALLTVTVIDSIDKIESGRQVQFFIEKDQNFRLPYAMYQRDPSLFLSIPEAGIDPQLFDMTTRVNLEGKAFTVSKLAYGKPNEVSYPNSVTDIRIEFKPNVVLGQGSVVLLTLPGFSFPYPDLPMKAPDDDLYTDTFHVFLYDAMNETHYCSWLAESEQLQLTVAEGKTIATAKSTRFVIPGEGGFGRLPAQLKTNDRSLTIQSTEGQIILEESIKQSDEVIGRMFTESSLSYTPKNKLSTFMMKIHLVATVNITANNAIKLKLPGFVNVMAYTKIHLSGRDARYVEIPETTVGGRDEIVAAATWIPDLEELVITPIHGESDNFMFYAYNNITLTIEESQGFILPRTLYQNDPSIKVSSVNNVLQESVKISPLVGDGPYEAQRFCFTLYEKGTRTANPICRRNPCYPPIRDPCSKRELERCLCEDTLYAPTEMVVHGFQLYAEDRLVVIDESRSCADPNLEASPQFKVRANPTVSFDRQTLVFPNVTSTETGYYKLCLIHFGEVFDIGSASVRPACNPSELVMVEGICVEHCPTSKVPVAGTCKTDPVAVQPVDTEAILVSIRLKQNEEASQLAIFSMSWEDPERQQFVYQFSSEMGKFLNVGLNRFKITSVSNGSVIVNVVMTPSDEAMEAEPSDAMSDRSPRGLLSLLRMLQSDEMSAVYSNKFFQNVDRVYQPPPVFVRPCEDGEYRTICHYLPLIPSVSQSVVLFITATGVAMVVLMFLCMVIWTLDKDTKGTDLNDFKDDGTVIALKPEMEAEFARSWLESRHTMTVEQVKKNANKQAMAVLKNQTRAAGAGDD